MNKIKYKYRILKDQFTKNAREIVTSVVEIIGAIAIAVGSAINWGIGTGLIVAGVETLILSYLASLVVTE